LEILRFSKKVEAIEGKQAAVNFEVNKRNVTGKWFKNGKLIDFRKDKR